MPAFDTLVAEAGWYKLEQADISTLQTLHNEVKASAEKKDLVVLSAKEKALDSHLTALQSKKAELAKTITEYRAEIATLLEPFKQQLATLQTEVQGATPATAPAEAPKKEPWFFTKLFTSDDPAWFFHSWKAGFGKAVVGTLAAIGGMFGMATAAKSLFSKDKTPASTEKGELQKQFEWFTNKIATWFGVPSPFKEVTAPASPEAIATPSTPETAERQALLVRLENTKLDFKENIVKERAKLLTTKALTLLVSVGEKFPGLRITSTIRTEEENAQLKNSADDSCHCYGEWFDIWRDMRTPPQYTLEEVKAYIDGINTPKTALIHGENAENHLHIDTLENKDLANKWTKEKLDAAKVA
jgi:hypothetical protein